MRRNADGALDVNLISLLNKTQEAAGNGGRGKMEGKKGITMQMKASWVETKIMFTL